MKALVIAEHKNALRTDDAPHAGVLTESVAKHVFADSSGKNFAHIVWDDVQVRCRVKTSTTPIRRDPLVAALFGSGKRQPE